MNFENFGLNLERNVGAEVQALSTEALDILAQASKEERATFLELKELENNFLSNKN